MATSRKIVVSPEQTGLWRVEQSTGAAEITGDLLNRDLKDHHVYLNNSGFHDHMLHHVLALYGTGASSSDIQRAYELRDSLQRPVQPSHENVISDLIASWHQAPKYLGKEEHYPDFLAYFQKTIDSKGYEWTVNEHLLKRDAASDDLLTRLHAGVLHPLIQLMYALEWKQPAIVAEALAQTCVHNLEGLDELLPESERRAGTGPRPKMPSLLALYEQIRQDSQLVKAARFEDKSKIEDGILQRAKEPMLAVLEQVHIEPGELEERTAEMFHTIILVASSAAIHPPHRVKYDFFLMHHVNSALTYLTTMKEGWITEHDKRRLLEWKIRMDLIQYVARGCPEISTEDINAYTPKLEGETNIRAIGTRLQDFGDDGHGIKQARATAVCHELMKKYHDKPWAILTQDETWQKIQHMVVDALEAPGALYVRSTGFDEAWESVPPQSAPKRSPEALRALQTGRGSSKEALNAPS